MKLTIRLLLMMVLGMPDIGASQGTCGPSPLGDPCAQGGLAMAGQTEPGPSLGVGNPIHLVTGNKYQQETDMPASAAWAGLEIVRHYNSQDRRPSWLGAGWALSYDTRLRRVGKRWQIEQADGSRVVFGTRHDIKASTQGHLTQDEKTWLWTWPNGRRLRFNSHGYLTSIEQAGHFSVHIQRKPPGDVLAHAIERIDNDRGAWMSFAYEMDNGKAGLSHIDTPLGRFRYLHRSTMPQRLLIAVTRPDGMQRRYLYESERQTGNVHALTGIEIVSADRRQQVRTNTWAYDAQGRAVLSIAGPPGSTKDMVTLQYVRPPGRTRGGLTIAHNAQKQSTRFLTARRGQKLVLTGVSGAGCPGCPQAGSHAKYDEAGKLLGLNGTRLLRDPDGLLRGLHIPKSGWPGLRLHYHSNGAQHAWHSRLTGTETLAYNNAGLPVRRDYANGGTVHYFYDHARRPLRLLEQRHGKPGVETLLAWHGSLLTQIRHPEETEARSYDEHQRLRERHIERPAEPGTAGLRYTESFEYDASHRLTRHHLPEGGSLVYQWHTDGRLRGIAWHDVDGNLHDVISTVPGKAGYRYGNGLHLRMLLDKQGRLGQLNLLRRDKPVWISRLQYNGQGRLAREHHAVPAAGHDETWSYAYDAEGRLIGAQGNAIGPDGKALSPPDTYWYAWHRDGSLAATRRQDANTKPAITRDASGLPLSIAGRQLMFGANRRLQQVRQDGKVLASYRHNAFGHRIASHDAHGRRDYLYLDNRVAAELRPGLGDEQTTPLPVTRRYIYAHHVPVGFIDYRNGSAGQSNLYFVHAGPIGAPRLITDQAGALRWLARYDPMGQARRIAGDLTLDLRLPGQLMDAATGWHDNILRTYLPAWGQYLEPDPLGPVPGTQALGYARQQPRRYADPLGLILFAFDGTRHSPQTQSNVWKLSQAYRDGPVYYHAGPGNSMYLDWDAATASSAGQIIENQWQSLLNVLSQAGNTGDHVPIDIIGFSRGAALARHFGNLINQHTTGTVFSYSDALRGAISACVDLRFMGLFDTVAQFGLGGSDNKRYDLSISPAWEWVAHAVALHERRWLFPLTSAASANGSNVVEAPFIGAHANIGGGVLSGTQAHAQPQGDLSDVALNWMLWQARAAALQFDMANDGDREINQPVLHDERSAAARSVQDGDRSVDTAAGELQHRYQEDHARLGREPREQTEALIERLEHWRRQTGTAVGMVDMSGYARWLHDELGWGAMP